MFLWFYRNVPFNVPAAETRHDDSDPVTQSVLLLLLVLLMVSSCLVYWILCCQSKLSHLIHQSGCLR